MKKSIFSVCDQETLRIFPGFHNNMTNIYNVFYIILYHVFDWYF